jgi:hypothetical protein
LEKHGRRIFSAFGALNVAKKRKDPEKKSLFLKKNEKKFFYGKAAKGALRALRACAGDLSSEKQALYRRKSPKNSPFWGRNRALLLKSKKTADN